MGGDLRFIRHQMGLIEPKGFICLDALLSVFQENDHYFFDVGGISQLTAKGILAWMANAKLCGTFDVCTLLLVALSRAPSYWSSTVAVVLSLTSTFPL